jgi:hypothetical protein
MKDDFVYILIEEDGDPSLVKIGHSVDPVNRLSGYKAGNHRRLRILATLIGGQPLEAEIHDRFPELRVGNGGDEWFKLSPDLVSFLQWKLKDILTGDSVLVYSGKDFGGPISIPPVELGAVDAAPVRTVASVDSVQPHSVAEVEPPKNPYDKVGRKDTQ